MKFADDTELFATMRAKLFTAVVGDVLDRMGFLHQFLPPHIRPLRDDMVAVGRAMPTISSISAASNIKGGIWRRNVTAPAACFRIPMLA